MSDPAGISAHGDSVPVPYSITAPIAEPTHPGCETVPSAATTLARGIETSNAATPLRAKTSNGPIPIPLPGFWALTSPRMGPRSSGRPRAIPPSKD